MAYAEGIHSTYLNEGKFGSVSHLEGTGLAWKTVHADTSLHRAELYKEFSIGIDVHDILSNSGRITDFYCPAYHAYFCPQGPNEAEDLEIEHDEIPEICRLYTLERPRSSIVMDTIPSLSPGIVDAYRAVTSSSVDIEVRLIRLYLGRASVPSTSKLQKASDTDPPITLQQYEALQSLLGMKVKVPSVEELCKAMGDMIGRLHWGAGVNGRDAELCLAGDRSEGLRLVIFDWNMCERWLFNRPLRANNVPVASLTSGAYADQDLVSGARRRAMLISSCESYYPRPHQADAYVWFKAGYQKGVKAVVCQYTPSPDETQEVLDRYQQLTVGYARGVQAFFEIYEQTDKEKMERRARMSGR